MGGSEGRSPPSCIPNPATCAVDSEALRSKVSLRVSPAALKAQGKRVLSEKIAAGELFRQAEAGAIRLPLASFCKAVRSFYSVTICHVLSNPCDTGSSGVTVPIWATYSPSCVGTGARSAPRYWLAVQQQSASVRPVASRKP